LESTVLSGRVSSAQSSGLEWSIVVWKHDGVQGENSRDYYEYASFYHNMFQMIFLPGGTTNEAGGARRIHPCSLLCILGYKKGTGQSISN
jgi:hypothetical protein